MIRSAEEALLQTGHEPLVRRGTPKLNGSSKAFVALLIVLTVIIISACSAAIYLLWDGSTNKDRRSRVRRYQASGIEAAAADSSWMARLTKVFGSRTTKVPICSKPQKGQVTIKGWIQSVERERKRDTLDTIEEQPEEVAKDDTGSRNMAQRQSFSTISSPSMYDTSRLPLQLARPPLAVHRSSSFASSNRSMSVSFVHHGTPRTQHSIPSISETVASKPPSPSISLSLAEQQQQNNPYVYPNGRGRPFATRSGTSMTFEGGTKFMEEL